MARIHRSINTVTGDATVEQGDVVITDESKGIVMEDQVGDTNRVKVVDDNGVKTIVVEEL